MTSTSATTSTGTVVTSGSTTYIASTASGLDTSSLVAAAVATKTAAADTIDAQVTANKAKISAYTQVQTLINAVSSSVGALASAANIPSGSTSAFDATAASVSASADGSASDAVAVSTDSSATTGSYSLGVTQLATAMKVSGSAMDGTAALGLTGSFTLGVTGGPSAAIVVTSGMSLTDVAAAISAQSATTGVNAALIKVADGSYQLVLSGAQTAQTIVASDTSGASVLNAIGLTGSDGSFSHVLQAPKDAVLVLDGTTITRSSNTIDDVIPGVTLSLDATTASDSSLSLDVTADYAGVKTDVTNFISAYNALRDYISSQNAVTDGAVDPNAVLFADTMLRNLDLSLKGAITGPSASATGGVNYLSDLGITIDANNDLALSDETALDTAILSNVGGVQSFFQGSTTTSDPGLQVLGDAATTATAFTLNVAVDASGAVKGATVGGQAGLFSVSGSQITGMAGTPYAGMSFYYSGTTGGDIDVAIKPGFADQLVGLGGSYGNTGAGLLQNQINGLAATDVTLAANATQIRSNASDYQTTLINKYAQMETQISAEKILQQELAAILNGGANNG